jgi:hypothetical protein
MLAGKWLIVGNGSAVRTKQRRTAKKPQAIIVIGTLTALVEEIFQSTGWRLLAPLRWYGRQRERPLKSRRRK